LAPAPPDVERIVAIRNPVLRNLEITYAYSLLAAELASRSGEGANWCTFATWASRQAGRTIRGEDALGFIEDRLGQERSLLHPVASFGRWLLRRGLLDPSSRIGRMTARFHTPFDAVERASDAVARGNLKVFAEIGLEFSRYESGEDLTTDAPLLRDAFARYDALAGSAKERAETLLLANLEIGLHEQTRLQPEIAEALDAPYVTAEDLGERLIRGPRVVQRAVGRVAMPIQNRIAELSREAITEALMVLALPGRLLSLGLHLEARYPDALVELVNADLVALVNGYEPVPPAHDDCGARDWSSLEQRMHYIVHLFRAFHADPDLFDAPFTAAEVESFLAGVVPEGDL
jgi:hypothetical protein